MNDNNTTPPISLDELIQRSRVNTAEFCKKNSWSNDDTAGVMISHEITIRELFNDGRPEDAYEFVKGAAIANNLNQGIGDPEF